MRTFIAASTLVAASHALVARETGCCFHITATGGPGGKVGQLSDGQNRIGQSGLGEAQYCLNSNGLTDSNGRGCILTPPTSQWQCDAGAYPTSGFSVGSDGSLARNGSTAFYACPTGDNGGYNIYAQTLIGEPNCVPIKLTADNCKASTPTAAPTPPKSTCPADLPRGFEFPHLIVPIDEANPSKSYGTSYNGTAGGSMSSIFNFDIPQSATGKTCNLKFLFPKQSQLETSAYTFSGAGVFKFAALNGAATEATTYATSPTITQDFGSFAMTPGTAWDIASIGCPAGTRFGIWFHATADSYLDYFQDYNPCPIGMYITVS